MGSSDAIAVGGRFGDLVVEAELGHGAFGTVYRAHDTIIGRTVALKVVRPPGVGDVTEEFRRRFLREARALGALVHPNVATLYRVHAVEAQGFVLELEFVDGRSYDALLAGGRRLSPEEAVALARGVAAGLRAAHAARIVHGDVKPANVLRGADGVVKLVDFGLARVVESETARSSAAHLAGTPQFLAPEVLEGAPRAPAGDVWSLGVLLYRALAGRLPFDAESMPGLFFRILNTEPAPLPEATPRALRDFVFACLAKRPDDRPALDDDLLATLERRPEGLAASLVAPTLHPTAHGLVGRAAELVPLRAQLARVLAGATEVVVLTGPAGVGKSRLAAALAQDARARGCCIVASTISATEGLLRPLHRSLLAATRGSDAARRAVGLGADGTAVDAEVAHLAAVEARLVAVAAERAAVVWLDDLHRATAEDVRLLGRLVARVQGSRVLFVVTERVPDVDAPAGAPPRCDALLADRGTRVDVGTLPRDVLARLLHDLGDGDAPTDLVERAAARAGGNPLFAIHLLAHAIEAREAARRDGLAAPSASASADPPPLLRDLMTKRLRGLPEDLREVLDAAAIDGCAFDAEGVADALAIAPLEVLRRLQRLAHRPGLVEPLERGYRFAHPLLQETVYAEVAPDLRRLLHRAYALGLEARGAGVDAERLGGHWERSDAPIRATPHLLRAAQQASQRSESWRCVDLAFRAGVVPGAVPDALVRDHAAALLTVTSALGECRRHPERERLLDDLAAAGLRLGEPSLAHRVWAWRGLGRALGSGLADGDEAKVREAAEALPSGLDRGIAHYVLGTIARHRGALDDAARELRRADAEFLAAGAAGRHGSALNQLGALAMSRGELAAAADLYREAARVSRDAGSGANAEISEINASLADLTLGRLEGVAPRLEASIRRIEADGAGAAAARARVVLAEVRFARGDLADAIDLAERACGVLDALGMRPGIFEAHATAAELRIAAGDGERALAHVVAARGAAVALGDPSAIARVDAIEALGHWADGREPQARDAAARAEATLRDAGIVAGVPDALLPVVEAIALGLDPGALRGRTPTGDVADLAAPPVDLPRLLCAAIDAAHRRDPTALSRAADVAEGPGIGVRRAALRCLAAGWRAIAARDRGNEGEADRLADAAIADARRLGHVPMQHWLATGPARGQA